jgi:phage terminase Nu1 subunit (DNA packaging protein)
MSWLAQDEIDEMVRRHPLPANTVDCVLNREELAAALGTSLPTISAWIAAGMPVRQMGGSGMAYELQLSHCYAWRQAQKANEELRSQEARKAIEAMRLALVGGQAGDTLEALDPKTRREIIAAQIEQERFMQHRNLLLRRDDVRDGLEEMLTLVRDVMDAAPDRVERIQGMPPKAVEAFIDVCDSVIDELRTRIARFWLQHPEGAPLPTREDLFDA